jgi:hypothetical protein
MTTQLPTEDPSRLIRDLFGCRAKLEGHLRAKKILPLHAIAYQSENLAKVCRLTFQIKLDQSFVPSPESHTQTRTTGV